MGFVDQFRHQNKSNPEGFLSKDASISDPRRSNNVHIHGDLHMPKDIK